MVFIEGLYEVAINNEPFRIAQGEYARRFLDVVRQQADTSGEPSENSLNPNDLWRRAQSEWIYGEGQLYLDDQDGIRQRFYTSDGLEPFCDCKKIHPHFGAARVDSLGSTLDYREAVVTSNAVYIRCEGEPTLEKFDSAQSTTAAADGTNNIVAVVTVGDTLLAATSGGVFEYDEGGDSWSLANNATPDIMDFVKGRLMVADGPDIYNITDLGTTTIPSSLTSGFIDSTFTWTAFGDAPGFILCAGIGGQQSLLYQITIQQDGTALESPVQVAQFPNGERVRAIKSYLGITAFATSEGVRIGQFSDGNLVYGPRIYEGNDVYDLEPKGKYIYFTRNGGLGKINLARFLPGFELAPAYAMSYRADDGLDVYSVISRPPAVTIGDNTDYEIMFVQDTNGGTTDGGLYESQATYTQNNSEFNTGRITYKMADQKNFMFLEVDAIMADPDDQILVYQILEDDTESLLGQVNATEDRRTFFIDETGEFISFKFEFVNGDATFVDKPQLNRWTLRALPIPSRTEQIQIPLDLRATQLKANGGVDMQDVWDKYSELQEYVRSGESVTYQEFDRTYLGSLENIQLGPDLDVDQHFDDWEGIAIVTLRIYDTSVVVDNLGGTDDGDDMFGIGQFGIGTFGDRQ